MTLPLISVEANERGSVSIRGSEHLVLEITKQTQFGEIESKIIIRVEPNSALHVVAQENPVPNEFVDYEDSF